MMGWTGTLDDSYPNVNRLQASDDEAVHFQSCDAYLRFSISKIGKQQQTGKNQIVFSFVRSAMSVDLTASSKRETNILVKPEN